MCRKKRPGFRNWQLRNSELLTCMYENRSQSRLVSRQNIRNYLKEEKRRTKSIGMIHFKRKTLGFVQPNELEHRIKLIDEKYKLAEN